MKTVKVLWEGNLPLDRIRWNGKSAINHDYFRKYRVKSEKYWKEHLKKYPNDYDGTLLFLEKYNFDNNVLDLKISLFRYSMANYLFKQNIPLKKGYGALGTQYLVFSPKRDFILVGKRALTQSYYPGAINVPGGILELNDLATDPSIALIRELREEFAAPLQSDFNLVAILGGWDNVSVTLLISAVIDKENFNPNDTYPSDNYEWETNLRWLSLKLLKKKASTNFLDGLTYFQSKLKTK